MFGNGPAVCDGFKEDSTSIEDLLILRGFDFGKITKRPFEDLREESVRLGVLQSQTIVKYGEDEEVREAR